MKYSKRLAVFFSFVPGAGHMYLGLITQGIQIMLLFFFTIFIASSASLNLSLFAIFIPVIWFYSVFDAFSKATSEEPLIDSNLKIFNNVSVLDEITKGNSFWKLMGYLLILAGIFFLLNNTLFPLLNAYLDYTIVKSIKSVLISAVMIVAGLVLLTKGKKNIHMEGEEECIKEK